MGMRYGSHRAAPRIRQVENPDGSVRRVRFHKEMSSFVKCGECQMACPVARERQKVDRFLKAGRAKADIEGDLVDKAKHGRYLLGRRGAGQELPERTLQGRSPHVPYVGIAMPAKHPCVEVREMECLGCGQGSVNKAVQMT